MLSKPQIIKAIRGIHRRQEPLNILAVKRYHPELIQAAYAVKPFWGWKTALQDAGIDYAKIKIELEETITCELCGKPWRNLATHLILKHQVEPDEYLMDYPESALICALLRSSLLQRGKTPIRHWEPCWSREYVLDRVAEYHRQNYPMHYGKFTDTDNSLILAANRYWGGWNEALIAAGLDPRKVTKEAYLQLRKYPDNKSVVKGIQQRLKKGLPLNSGALQIKRDGNRSHMSLL